MPDQFLRQIIPVPQPAPEIFAAYQVTYEFYREVQLREALEQHCQWYEQVAEQHRRELEVMRQEFNLMGWFNRRRTGNYSRSSSSFSRK